jgi:hypothetical protein
VSDELRRAGDTSRAYRPGERFRSNNGRGPFTGVVRYVKGGLVFLDYLKDGGKACGLARLPVWFFSSPACGWKEIAPEE